MQPDILLGAVTVCMAVLGGIVSAHAPTKAKHKVCYIVAFVGLGIWADVLVGQQSKQTTQSEAELRNQISILQGTASQSERLQQSNNDLQQQVIRLSKTNALLAKQTIETVTGGNSYCWMDLVFGIRPAPVPVFVYRGENTIYDVTARISDITKMYRRIERREGFSPISDDINVTIGEMQVGRAWVDLPLSVPFTVADAQDFNIFFGARNGIWTEKLRLRNVGGHWRRAVQVWFSPVGLKVRPKKPAFEQVDSDFPRAADGNVAWDRQ